MDDLHLSGDREAAVSALARMYLWWEAVNPSGHTAARKVAQIMHLGTYEDIRRLETILTTDELSTVMRLAQPGWFDARSWGFWRGRLEHDGQRNIPSAPPRRAFLDADVP